MEDLILLVRELARMLILVATLLTPATAEPLPTTAPASPTTRPNRPAVTIGSGPGLGISGKATWYAWKPGQAAAGPGLRKWLGKNWRGQTVTVWYRGKHVTVRLTDWCACANGRIIDLDVRSFSVLAWKGLGVLPVKVTR